MDSGRELDAILDTVADEGLIGPGALVASADNWQRSAILCFRLDCTYLGQPDESSGPVQRSELLRAGIGHFLAWSDDTEAPTGTRLEPAPTRSGGSGSTSSPAPTS